MPANIAARNLTRTPGIIIRCYPSGDADLVVRVFTPELGKIAAFAKQARRSRKRFPGGLDAFDHGTVTLQEGRGELLIINDLEPATPWRNIREDLTRLSVATTLCEACDILFKEGEIDTSEAYSSLELSLSAIDSTADQKAILRAAFLGLSGILKTAGFLEIAALRPSRDNLIRLVKHLETSAERELLSKPALLDTLRALNPLHSD